MDRFTLSFDVSNPPKEPPAGTDQITWRLAYQILEDHQPCPSGWCSAVTCVRDINLWPCPPALFAQGIFALAALGP